MNFLLHGQNALMLVCARLRYVAATNWEFRRYIRELDGETKACMKYTERYYKPVATWFSDADVFASAVNPILLKVFGDDSLRARKTDKADSKKIARCALGRWAIIHTGIWTVSAASHRILSPGITKTGVNAGYNFSAKKAEKIYQSSSDLIAVFPKDENTKMLI